MPEELLAFRMDSGIWQVADDHHCIVGWSWAPSAEEAIEDVRRRMEEYRRTAAEGRQEDLFALTPPQGPR